MEPYTNRKIGRVVDRGSLENCCTARYRRFESYILREKNNKYMLIKNQTPYLGKIRLKFERFPHYSGQTKLNKIHLDLGFTKLVSRIIPERDLEGWVVNPECIKQIESCTGLKVVGWQST